MGFSLATSPTQQHEVLAVSRDLARFYYRDVAGRVDVPAAYVLLTRGRICRGFDDGLGRQYLRMPCAPPSRPPMPEVFQAGLRTGKTRPVPGRVVDVHRTRLEPTGDLAAALLVAGPHAGGQAVGRAVDQPAL